MSASIPATTTAPKSLQSDEVMGEAATAAPASSSSAAVTVATTSAVDPNTAAASAAISSTLRTSISFSVHSLTPASIRALASFNAFDTVAAHEQQQQQTTTSEENEEATNTTAGGKRKKRGAASSASTKKKKTTSRATPSPVPTPTPASVSPTPIPTITRIPGLGITNGRNTAIKRCTTFGHNSNYSIPTLQSATHVSHHVLEGPNSYFTAHTHHAAVAAAAAASATTSAAAFTASANPATSTATAAAPGNSSTVPSIQSTVPVQPASSSTQTTSSASSIPASNTSTIPAPAPAPSTSTSQSVTSTSTASASISQQPLSASSSQGVTSAQLLQYVRRIWRSTPLRQLFTPMQLYSFVTDNDKVEYHERWLMLNQKKEEARRIDAAVRAGKEPPPSTVTPVISLTPMYDRLRESQSSLSQRYNVPGFLGSSFRGGSALDSFMHASQQQIVTYEALVKRDTAAHAAATKAARESYDRIAKSGVPGTAIPFPAPLSFPPPPHEYRISLVLHLYQHGFALNGGADGDKNFHLYSDQTADFLRSIDSGCIPAMFDIISFMAPPAPPPSNSNIPAPPPPPSPPRLHFYDGYLICGLKDHRFITPANALRGTTTKYLLLRPTPQTIDTDVKGLLMGSGEEEGVMSEMIEEEREKIAVAAAAASSSHHSSSPPKSIAANDFNTSCAYQQVAFALEATILRVTKRAICLDPSPRVMQVANFNSYHRGKPFVRGVKKDEAKVRAIEMLQAVGETEDMAGTPPQPHTPYTQQYLHASRDDVELPDYFHALKEGVIVHPEQQDLPGNGWYEHQVPGNVEPVSYTPPPVTNENAAPTAAQAKQQTDSLMKWLKERTNVGLIASSHPKPFSSPLSSPSTSPSPRTSTTTKASKRGRATATKDETQKESPRASKRAKLKATEMVAEESKSKDMDTMMTDVKVKIEEEEKKESMKEDESMISFEELLNSNLDDTKFGLIEGVGTLSSLACLEKVGIVPSTTTASSELESSSLLPSPATISLLNYASFVHYQRESLPSSAHINSFLLDHQNRVGLLSGKTFAVQQGVPPHHWGEAPGDRGVITPFLTKEQAATVTNPSMPLQPPAPPPQAGVTNPAPNQPKKIYIHMSSQFPKIAPEDRPIRGPRRPNEWTVWSYISTPLPGKSRSISELLLHALPYPQSSTSSQPQQPLPFSGIFHATFRQTTHGEPSSKSEIIWSYRLTTEEKVEQLVRQFKKQMDKDLRMPLTPKPMICVQSHMPQTVFPTNWNEQPPPSASMIQQSPSHPAAMNMIAQKLNPNMPSSGPYPPGYRPAGPPLQGSYPPGAVGPPPGSVPMNQNGPQYHPSQGGRGAPAGYTTPSSTGASRPTGLPNSQPPYRTGPPSSNPNAPPYPNSPYPPGYSSSNPPPAPPPHNRTNSGGGGGSYPPLGSGAPAGYSSQPPPTARGTSGSSAPPGSQQMRYPNQSGVGGQNLQPTNMTGGSGSRSMQPYAGQGYASNTTTPSQGVPRSNAPPPSSYPSPGGNYSASNTPVGGVGGGGGGGVGAGYPSPAPGSHNTPRTPSMQQPYYPNSPNMAPPPSSGGGSGQYYQQPGASSRAQSSNTSASGNYYPTGSTSSSNPAGTRSYPNTPNAPQPNYLPSTPNNYPVSNSNPPPSSSSSRGVPQTYAQNSPQQQPRSGVGSSSYPTQQGQGQQQGYYPVQGQSNYQQQYSNQR